MRRRDFILSCSYTGICGMGLSSLLASCANVIYYGKYAISNNVVSLNKSEFHANGIERQFVLIKLKQEKYPVCIYKLSENEFSALFMQCTHKGCELEPHEDYLSCPCHGSEFDNRGNVQHPPAERKLITFKVNTDNENIYIHL